MPLEKSLPLVTANPVTNETLVGASALDDRTAPALTNAGYLTLLSLNTHLQRVNGQN